MFYKFFVYSLNCLYDISADRESNSVTGFLLIRYNVNTTFNCFQQDHEIQEWQDSPIEETRKQNVDKFGKNYK